MIAESMAIVRRIARLKGLYGKDENEMTDADVLADGIVDVRTKFGMAMYSRDQQQLTDFFAFQLNEFMPIFEKMLSNSKSKNGFFISDSLTFADIVAFDFFDVLQQVKSTSLRFYPKVLHFMAKVKEVDGIKQRIASRKEAGYEGKLAEPFNYKVSLPAPAESKLSPLPLHVFEAKGDYALIVLQEWWGVNDQIKSRAKEFQSKNITAVIPDLYRGKVATDHEEAHHLMGGLDWKGAVEDIYAGVKFLKSHHYKKIFVVGYCMGGALAIASAVHIGKEINGSIAFYGIPGKDLADPAKAAAPLQLHFGTKDSMAGFSDAKAQDALESDLKTNKIPHEFFRYEGLGHAFTNINNPNYDAKAAALGLERTVKFIESTK